MEKQYETILEFENILDKEIQKLKNNYDELVVKDSIKRELSELLKSKDRNERLLALPKEDIYKLFESVFDPKDRPTIDDIAVMQFLFSNPVFKNKQTQRFKDAEARLEKFFAAASSYIYKVSKIGNRIEGYKKEILYLSEIKSYFKDGKVVKNIVDLEKIIAVIEQIVPKADQVNLITDIVKSKLEFLQQVIHNLEEAVVEEQSKKIEESTEEENVEKPPIIEEVEKPVVDETKKEEKPEPVQQEEVDNRRKISLSEDKQKIFNDIKQKVLRKFEKLQIEQQTRYRIAETFVDLYSAGEMTKEEIKKSLTIEKHYEAFILIVLSRNIKTIDDILEDSYEEEDISDMEQILEEEYTTLVSTYNEEFNKPKVEQTDTAKSIAREGSEENPLPVIFIDNGKFFEKSMNRFSESTSNIAKTISSLREGYFSFDSPLLNRHGRTGFFIKGSSEKIIYKVYDDHIIIHSVMGRNELDTIDTVNLDSEEEEEMIRNKDAKYRKSLEKSNKILESLLGEKTKGGSK